MTAPAADLPLILRDYQREAIAAVLAAWERGVQRALLVLPTGTGKTVVFSHLLAIRPGRGLVLVHRDELIAQAEDKLRMIWPGVDLGIVKAERDEHQAQIVLASVQTLSRQNRLWRVRSDFETVVVDEGHHATADSYRRVLDYLGVFFAPGGAQLLGVTATPERADGTPLGAVFEEIVFQRDIHTMMRAGYLCGVRAHRVLLQVNLDQVRVRGGDFAPEELEAALTMAHAPQAAADAYLEHAPGRTALVFTVSVAHAVATARALVARGVAAEWLSGATPLEERRAMLARLRTGETKVIANCAVLTEGYDEPSVSAIVVARPTKSRPLYIQQAGRGLRTHPGKKNCIIIDLVGATSRHQLVTAGDLWQLAPDPVSTGSGGGEGEGQGEPRGSQVPAEVDGVAAAAVIDPFTGRELRWLTLDAHAAVLPLVDAQLHLVEEPGGDWSVYRVARRQGQRLVGGLSQGYAMGWAEDYVIREGAGPLVRPGGAWLRLPATDKQLALLRSLGLTPAPGMTRGAASDAITIAIARQGFPR